MGDLPAVVVSGIASGSAYALLALGLVIIFRSTDTVNFGIGDIGTLSVFISASTIAAGVPVAVGLIISIVVAGLIGVATERVLIRPLGLGRNRLFISLVVTIGLGLLINALIYWGWGTRSLPFKGLAAGTVDLGGMALSWNRVLATVLAATAMFAVAWFFRTTRFGMAMRATAEDQFAARMVGIDAGRVSALAWFLGCGLAAVASFFLAADNSLNPNLTLGPLFRAFAGVFLGGLTSMPGAVIGGFAVGVLDNLAGRYVSANYRDTIVFAIIVLVLFLRPAGVLGAGRKERV
ncbi:branched-chain amino acid ABC transporter permease [Paraburkholderia sp. BL10I2N1]|uniref:branched-chain amino acid ABC transporter permease n=1 Tax=Paraburkholderia sp. BL10I2N1 TaxID=1938796 RepID=UPI00105FF0F7|nr:branched-chain amino acid ABC transporter permease [Paraburkholderia sp. BL10I2N1]TDN61964.1 amino acid/amide ABC transporter membrane protein 1 (HAAT family) [Paraburkholderia sp. BL10I2N1]